MLEPFEQQLTSISLVCFDKITAINYFRRKNKKIL